MHPPFSWPMTIPLPLSYRHYMQGNQLVMVSVMLQLWKTCPSQSLTPAGTSERYRTSIVTGKQSWASEMYGPPTLRISIDT